MFSDRYVPLLAAFMLISIVGCGGGNQSDLARVTGTVLVDGQPAPAGVKLEFDPVTQGVRGSTAVTDASGAYEAVYSISRNGVRLGECVVKLAVPEVAPSKPGQKPKLPFPEKYYQEIRRVDITGGSNQLDFEISQTE